MRPISSRHPEPLTFAPGETQKSARVFVNGDEASENDEVFLVSFRNPTNATLGGFYGLGYGIINDDDSGVTIRPGAATITEPDRENTTIQIPVNLSQASASTVTVAWSAVPAGATLTRRLRRRVGHADVRAG